VVALAGRETRGGRAVGLLSVAAQVVGESLLAKPWAKYEIGFLRHAKFLALTSNAICLWLEAKSYCDEHLTDGLFPRTALRTFRFNGSKSVDSLMRSCGLKPNGDAYAPLWEAVDIGGVSYVRMHDFLLHNDCREVRQKGMAAADARREADKQRKAAARAAKEAKRSASVSAGLSAPCPQDVRADVRTDVQPMSASIQRQRQSNTPQPPSGGLLVSDDVADKAGEFLGRYPGIYARAKAGAYYHVREARDFPLAMELVTQWPDLEHLEKMLELFLRKADWAPKNVPGSPGQFRHMAPECDALLRKNGHFPAVSRVAS
jgi:hypothetical protein